MTVDSKSWMNVRDPENRPAICLVMVTSKLRKTSVGFVACRIAGFSRTSSNDALVIGARLGQYARTYTSDAPDLESCLTNQFTLADVRCRSSGACIAIEHEIVLDLRSAATRRLEAVFGISNSRSSMLLPTNAPHSSERRCAADFRWELASFSFTTWPSGATETDGSHPFRKVAPQDQYDSGLIHESFGNQTTGSNH
jgi:hypothetical protein